jgi:hypothetical protein
MVYPGLASWAKFSRPCGTHIVVGSHPHTLLIARGVPEVRFRSRAANSDAKRRDFALGLEKRASLLAAGSGQIVAFGFPNQVIHREICLADAA